jgi:hypothetical protein
MTDRLIPASEGRRDTPQRRETVQIITLRPVFDHGTLVWQGPSGLATDQNSRVAGIVPHHVNDRITMQVVRFDGPSA